MSYKYKRIRCLKIIPPHSGVIAPRAAGPHRGGHN